MGTPQLSVRTEGPRQWSITVQDRPEAERARRDFREGGLTCSPIEQQGRNFVFMADGRPMEESLGSETF